MSARSLADFIVSNRDDLIGRCAAKQQKNSIPARTMPASAIPQFLDQLVVELGPGPAQYAAMKASALQHGRELFSDGHAVGQLVHDYGGVCQSITDLAVETGAEISTSDFRTLNRCLDDAIAAAVAEYLNQERTTGDADAIHVRNIVYMAGTTFDVIREGKVGVSGATGDLLQRSLTSLKELVDRRPK